MGRSEHGNSLSFPQHPSGVPVPSWASTFPPPLPCPHGPYGQRGPPRGSGSGLDPSRLTRAQVCGRDASYIPIWFSESLFQSPLIPHTVSGPLIMGTLPLPPQPCLRGAGPVPPSLHILLALAGICTVCLGVWGSPSAPCRCPSCEEIANSAILTPLLSVYFTTMINI